MSSKNEKTIIVIRQTNLESVIQDGITFCVLIAVMLVSHLLNSQAVGWLGAILFFLALFARWAGHRTFYTIAEARTKLDELEKQQQ